MTMTDQPVGPIGPDLRDRLTAAADLAARARDLLRPAVASYVEASRLTPQFPPGTDGDLACDRFVAECGMATVGRLLNEVESLVCAIYDS